MVRILLMSVLALCVAEVKAQQVLEYSEPAFYGGPGNDQGMMYWYTDSYTNANGCKNSVEYLPPGFDFNDNTTKYPLIIFFPGKLESVAPNDNNNGGKYPANTKPSKLGLDVWNWSWPSIIKLQRLPIPSYLRERYVPKNVSHPVTGQSYAFIIVAIQCGQDDVIEDYWKMLRGYVFNKYQDKIDPGRIYITGLSLGGGKTMELLADPTRANFIAAAAPVATGTECPYTTEWIPNKLSSWPYTIVPCPDQSKYQPILDNIKNRSWMGVFFNHNENDKSLAPVTISKSFYDPLSADPLSSSRVGAYFNPAPAPPGDDFHYAWNDAYDETKTQYNGTNFYRWFLRYQSPNTLIPLPLMLTNLTVQSTGDGQVNLRWTTSMESNTSHFEVERSVDGKNFTRIGRVESAGNSNTLRSYSMVDGTGGEETLYYRLKMMDRDARFEYSPTKKISLAQRGLKFQLTPNPVLTTANLRIDGQARGNMSLSLFNQTGARVRDWTVTKNASTLTHTISLEGLPAGLYLLSVKGDGINYNERLLKQ